VLLQKDGKGLFPKLMKSEDAIFRLTEKKLKTWGRSNPASGNVLKFEKEMTDETTIWLREILKK
jgi:hypothetical protein